MGSTVRRGQAGSNGLNMAALHLAAYMQHEKDFWFRLCGVSRLDVKHHTG